MSVARFGWLPHWFMVGFSAGGAVAMFHHAIALWSRWSNIGRWDSVPATIQELSYRQSRAQFVGEVDRYEIRTQYYYQYKGNAYSGHHVSLEDYPPRTFNEYEPSVLSTLKIMYTNGKVHCLVNPRKPEEAVLLDRPMGVSIFASAGMGAVLIALFALQTYVGATPVGYMVGLAFAPLVYLFMLRFRGSWFLMADSFIEVDKPVKSEAEQP